MLGPLRYCTHIKHINHAALAFNNSFAKVVAGLAGRVQSYSQDKGTGCCKDIAQTTGKKVEPWPKNDPPPQKWRADCPQEPQPPNYDPYRIKVPDVVVPPLPPSNVKRTGMVFTSSDDRPSPRRGYDSGYNHQQPSGTFRSGDQQETDEEENKDSSFLGLLKGFFGRLRGKGKEDSDAMIDNREYLWLRY